MDRKETLKEFTADQVAEHHTTHSLWLIVHGLVYDLTNFLFDHPGGEEFLLQYGGQDVSAIMASETEHVHSDVAYEMLKDYCIGKLVKEKDSNENLKKEDIPTKALLQVSDSAVDLRASDSDFIDVTKPMFPQVLFGKFDVETYVKQVHIPRHTKDSPPLFGNFLEPLTKTYWWVIPLFYAPIITFAYSRSLETIMPNMAVAGFIAGLCNWTLIEYTLHRFIFHLDSFLPNNRVAMSLHFVTHGVHHFLPMDKMRLVMPPALGMILSLPIWTLYSAILPLGLGDAVVAGSYLGFVLYDLIHCSCFILPIDGMKKKYSHLGYIDYTHHGKPYGSYLKEVKSYHLDHHYKNSNLGYGVTSKFWDFIFGTLL